MGINHHASRPYSPTFLTLCTCPLSQPPPTQAPHPPPPNPSSPPSHPRSRAVGHTHRRCISALSSSDGTCDSRVATRSDGGWGAAADAIAYTPRKCRQQRRGGGSEGGPGWGKLGVGGRGSGGGGGGRGWRSQ